MIFQNWVLPATLAILSLFLGLAWARKLRRMSQESGTNTSISPPQVIPVALAAHPEAALMLGGILIVGLSQWSRLNLNEDQRWVTTIALLVGMGLFLFGAQAARSEILSPKISNHLGRLSTWLGIEAGGVILLGLSITMATMAAVATIYGINPISQQIAVVAWGIGIWLTIIGGWKAEPGGTTPGWRTVAWMTIFLAFAFIIRGINTAKVPIALTGDEGAAGLNTLYFLHGGTNNLFSIGSHSFPSFYFFLQTVPIAILGTTSQALRIPSAIIGAFTVVGVYLMGKSMFGKHAGLIAGIALATAHFHIHFSRIGLNNIWDGLTFVVTLGALWYGWQHGRRASFLLAGLAFGFAQYFYATAHALPVLILLWLLLVGLQDPSRLKRALPNLAVMGVTALVVVLPLAWFYAKNPHELAAPMQGVKILGPWLDNEVAFTKQPVWSVLLNQVRLGFQAFTHTPVRYFYDPGKPMLLTLPATFFLLGAGLLLVRIRDGRSLMLGLWLLAIALIGALSESTPAAQRYVAAAPAVALVIGYGLNEVMATFIRLWPQRARVILLLTFGMTLIASANDLHFYFLKFTPAMVERADADYLTQRIVDHLQNKSDQWQLVYFPNSRLGIKSIPSLQYLAAHIEGYEMLQPWGSLENPRPTSNHLAFVILPEREGEIDLVKTAYPNGKLYVENNQRGETLFWLYETPAYTP